jgi:hypothetical protein
MKMLTIRMIKFEREVEVIQRGAYFKVIMVKQGVLEEVKKDENSS